MIDRKPNWNKWNLIDDAKVWQVIALSLDIDPDKIARGDSDWMAGGSYVNHEGDEFKDRLDVTKANYRKIDDTPKTLSMNGIEYCELNIPKFAKWAISVNWKIPIQLKKLAVDSVIEQNSKEWSYVEHEARNNLITSALDVSYNQYTDIFLLDSWHKTQALWYLLGIYEVTHLADDIHSVLIRTLDCYSYNSNDEKYVTDSFQSRLGRLTVLWESGNHPDLNAPSYYIEWAILKKQKINWLDDAIEDGFYKSNDNVIHKQKLETLEPVNQIELGRRDQQHEVILAIINALNYEPLKIPDGGKAKIKTICLKSPRSFTAHAFDHAWKKGLEKNLFRLENAEKYKP